MGVCDAIRRNAPVGKPTAMSAPHPPKVAGIDSMVPVSTQTAAPPEGASAAPGAFIQDRLAGWVSDLTTLHELTERLAATGTLDSALHEILSAGAALVGAGRGLLVLEPSDGGGPSRTIGLGLAHAELGHIETVPRGATAYGRFLEGITDTDGPLASPDILGDTGLDPRWREVAARLGYAASYTQPLTTVAAGRLGVLVWLYDEPAEPPENRRHLVGVYARYAAEHLARLLELERTRAEAAAIAEEFRPGRLPQVPGVRLAARHLSAPEGGGDWYDALTLPDDALGLAVGSAGGSGPSALAAMSRLRAGLRAYAVLEGEDPVAVLSDLELLLRLTEPAAAATALYAYCEPGRRTVLFAGAGHTPPLVTGDRRTEFVETTLSAPLGMLSCWEAPSVEFRPLPGETVLFYTDGLLRRTGSTTDRAFARLHSAAAGVPKVLRQDPGAVADHVLRAVLPDGQNRSGGTEDVALLAVRFG
ncbi:PP2C family protein-serine/threonine phosphatase [[Kitasatospora] papulosa]|uniref:PP2C family protein-serine/threonine phosphatase n=1 Tax=Streptomyces TaxID=1883 RepID=UPI001F3C4072|nr:PP2C family protein-serine/threonine phosphatase [Streptomyces sp. SID7815]